ncbi:hypothetical protein HN51_061962, partial [Arachis hypogaea]
MLEPTKNLWSGKGMNIISDGWNDPKGDEIKDTDYVAKQIRDVVKEFGLSN